MDIGLGTPHRVTSTHIKLGTPHEEGICYEVNADLNVVAKFHRYLSSVVSKLSKQDKNQHLGKAS